MGLIRRRVLVREEASERGVAYKVSRQRDETIFRPNSSEITSKGRQKEGVLATTSLEFEFHLHFSPSTELSDFRQSARSGNELNVNKY